LRILAADFCCGSLPGDPLPEVIMPSVAKKRPAAAKKRPAAAEPTAGRPVLVSIDSLRESHSFTTKRVYALLKTGDISSVLVGHRRLIIMASVDAYIARLATGYGPAPMPSTRRRSAA
jgi:hypothetical protein